MIHYKTHIKLAWVIAITLYIFFQIKGAQLMKLKALFKFSAVDANLIHENYFLVSIVFSF